MERNDVLLVKRNDILFYLQIIDDETMKKCIIKYDDILKHCW